MRIQFSGRTLAFQAGCRGFESRNPPRYQVVKIQFRIYDVVSTFVPLATPHVLQNLRFCELQLRFCQRSFAKVASLANRRFAANQAAESPFCPKLDPHCKPKVKICGHSYALVYQTQGCKSKPYKPYSFVQPWFASVTEHSLPPAQRSCAYKTVGFVRARLGSKNGLNCKRVYSLNKTLNKSVAKVQAEPLDKRVSAFVKSMLRRRLCAYSLLASMRSARALSARKAIGLQIRAKGRTDRRSAKIYKKTQAYRTQFGEQNRRVCKQIEGLQKRSFCVPNVVRLANRRFATAAQRSCANKSVAKVRKTGGFARSRGDLKSDFNLARAKFLFYCGKQEVCAGCIYPSMVFMLK